MLRQPSVKAIRKAFPYLSRGVASHIKRIISGNGNPETVPEVERWIRQCYHRPSEMELEAAAISALLGGHGLESLGSENSNAYGPPWGTPRAEYVNMGDTYDMTMLRDNASGRWIITAWGDWYERHERELAD